MNRPPDTERPSILVVARWPVGGIRSYLRSMLTQPLFASCDFTVVLVEGADSSALQADVTNSNVRWRFSAASTSALCLAVAKELSSRRYSLLHVHGFTAALVSVWPGRIFGAPTILTMHEVLTPGRFTGATGWFRRLLLRGTLRACSVVHAVSKDSEANLREYFPGLEPGRPKVQVISNGIDVDRFGNASVRALHNELAIDASTFIFGFFGRFMAPKGFRVLIDAVEILGSRPGTGSFVVVCVGGGGFIREDRANLQGRGLEAHFLFLPAVNNLASTIKGVDAVVMPSLWEAGSLLAMEAMVCGVPLISSGCVGLRESVLDTPARVVKTGDPLSLADAMALEMASPSSAAAGVFAEVARRRFDARNSFADLARLYEDVLGRS